MRIIDADSLKEKVSYQTRKIVDQEPTAYDVDKVVEELEELPSGYNCIASEFQRGANAGAAFIKKKAIDIVKAGGKNETNNT